MGSFLCRLALAEITTFAPVSLTLPIIVVVGEKTDKFIW